MGQKSGIRDRYSLQRYMDEYSAEDIDLVSSLLVEDLLDELGYSAAVKP